MNEDSLLTIFMVLALIIQIFVYYLLPVAGVVAGIILLKKEKKVLGKTILFISIAVCLVVAVWKITDITRFQ